VCSRKLKGKRAWKKRAGAAENSGPYRSQRTY
jgi:hypothetical protein